jgi:hypothetical protein
MNQKNLVLAGIGSLLLAGGIYLGSTFGKQNSSAPTDATDPASMGSAASMGAGNAQAGAGAKSSSQKRDAENAWEQLTKKYGDGRTKLSKKITQDMAGLITDAMEIADMAAAFSGASSAKDLAIKQTTAAIAARLNLSEEQKIKAADIIEARVAERMDAIKELSATLESDPTAMMETILAGDAMKRGEITQEEYDAISGNTLSTMRNISGFAFSGRGGNDLSDPLLAEQLNPILTPEQQQQLGDISKNATASQPQTNPQMPFQNGNLPAMELEKLDQTMGNAQKFTTGIKSVMEGMKGMKDLAPAE